MATDEQRGAAVAPPPHQRHAPREAPDPLVHRCSHGSTQDAHDLGAVFWNGFNRQVQCHRCGLTFKVLTEREIQVRQALALARSVIQSGENWSGTCERVIGGALA